MFGTDKCRFFLQVTSFFEFAARRPIAYTAVKYAVLVTSLMALVAMWSLLGQKVGALALQEGLAGQEKRAKADKDAQTARLIDKVMNEVFPVEESSKEALEKKPLLEALEENAEKSKERTLSGYTRFLCCFVNPEARSEKGANNTRFQCYPKAKQKLVNSSVQEALKCVSELIYEIVLDQK